MSSLRNKEIKTKKTISIIKHIDSFKCKDSYQVDTVQLSKYVMSDDSNIFLQW